MMRKLFLLFPKSLSLFAEEKALQEKVKVKKTNNQNHEHSEKERRVQPLDDILFPPTFLVSTIRVPCHKVFHSWIDRLAARFSFAFLTSLRAHFLAFQTPILELALLPGIFSSPLDEDPLTST